MIVLDFITFWDRKQRREEVNGNGWEEDCRVEGAEYKSDSLISGENLSSSSNNLSKCDGSKVIKED